MTSWDSIHVVALQVERGYEAEVGAWYRDELAPALAGDPAWLGMERLECITGEPTLWLFHVAGDIDPRRVVPYVDEDRGRRIRNYTARTFRKTFQVGDETARRELLNVVMTEIFPGGEPEWSAWYEGVHMPEIVACPGWLVGRRFVCTEAPTVFLAVYELEDAERPFNSPEFDQAVGWDDHLPKLRGYHGFRIYRREEVIELS